MRFRAFTPFLIPLALVVGAPSIGSPAHAEPPPSASSAQQGWLALQGGIVVISSGDNATSEASELARLVYGDPLLRPSSLDEATARALAGHAVDPSQSRAAELGALRRSLNPTDPAVGRLLKWICADVGASGALLVHQQGDRPLARLFVGAASSLYPTPLWKQPSQLGPSWQSAVSWLHAHAKGPASPAPKAARSTPWVWVAVGAAAGVAVAIFAASRDQTQDSIHLQGRVGP